MYFSLTSSVSGIIEYSRTC